MPGNVPSIAVEQVPAVSTGVSQLVRHHLGRAPRFITVFITNIDMATPGNFTRTINSVDQSNVDVTVIPAGMDFVLSMGK